MPDRRTSSRPALNGLGSKLASSTYDSIRRPISRKPRFAAHSNESGCAALAPARNRGAFRRTASSRITASSELAIPLPRSARATETPPFCAPSGCRNAPPLLTSAIAAMRPDSSSTTSRRSESSGDIASQIRHSSALPRSISPYQVFRSAIHGARSRSSNGRARYPLGRLAVSRSVSRAITRATIVVGMPASNRVRHLAVTRPTSLRLHQGGYGTAFARIWAAHARWEPRR